MTPFSLGDQKFRHLQSLIFRHGGLSYNDASLLIGVGSSADSGLSCHCEFLFDNSGFISFYRVLFPGMSESSPLSSVDPISPP